MCELPQARSVCILEHPQLTVHLNELHGEVGGLDRRHGPTASDAYAAPPVVVRDPLRPGLGGARPLVGHRWLGLGEEIGCRLVGGGGDDVG